MREKNAEGRHWLRVHIQIQINSKEERKKTPSHAFLTILLLQIVKSQLVNDTWLLEIEIHRSNLTPFDGGSLFDSVRWLMDFPPRWIYHFVAIFPSTTCPISHHRSFRIVIYHRWPDTRFRLSNSNATIDHASMPLPLSLHAMLSPTVDRCSCNWTRYLVCRIRRFSQWTGLDGCSACTLTLVSHPIGQMQTVAHCWSSPKTFLLNWCDNLRRLNASYPNGGISQTCSCNTMSIPSPRSHVHFLSIPWLKENCNIASVLIAQRKDIPFATYKIRPIDGDCTRKGLKRNQWKYVCTSSILFICNKKKTWKNNKCDLLKLKDKHPGCMIPETYKIKYLLDWIIQCNRINPFNVKMPFVRVSRLHISGII